MSKGWSSSVKYQPLGPHSEATSISFQDSGASATQGSNHNGSVNQPAKGVQVKPLKPPVPATKPPIKRTQSNPLNKPPIARKPSVTRGHTKEDDSMC